MALNQPTGLEVVHYQVDFDADPRSLVYTFGGAAAVASLRPPCVLETSTLDCFAGRVTSVEHRPSQRCDPRMLNPQTGPFYVEGAQPGDTLALHFARIEPHWAWGVSSTVPFFGSLTATPTTAMLHGALPELTWIYELDLQARTVRYEARERAGVTVDLPLDPMHGTVGVAPALGEARSSLTPGAWGGNMDTPEMRGRFHLLPGGQRRGSPVEPGRRPCPSGGRRDLRGGGRDGDGLSGCRGAVEGRGR